MKKLPKHVHGYTDRLGKARYYYKRTGSKPVALSGLPWSPGFMADYEAAHAAYEQPMAVPLGASRTKVGTLNAALVRYYESAAFLQALAKSTQGPQRGLLERWRKDHGELPLRPLQPKHVQGFISKLGSPSVQRNMLRAIRHFTKFALGAGLIDADPAVSVMRAKMTKTDGFYHGPKRMLRSSRRGTRRAPRRGWPWRSTSTLGSAKATWSGSGRVISGTVSCTTSCRRRVHEPAAIA
jgi:hypothetical protein